MLSEQAKLQLKEVVDSGFTEEDLAGMESMENAPPEEVAYLKELLAQKEQDIPQEVGAIAERFVIGAMTMASGKGYEKMLAMAQSAKENMSEGMGRALFFVLSGVNDALEKKDVDIPPELWLAENGLIAQTAKIVAILLKSAGVPLTQEHVAEGMQLAAESMAMEYDKGVARDLEEGEQGEAPPEQGQPQAAPPQQGMPPQGQPPQAAPPQQGMPPQGQPPQGLLTQGAGQ